MFEKLKEKLKRDNDPLEEIEFKKFEPEHRAEITSGHQAESAGHVKQDDSSHTGGVELRVVRPESYDEVSAVADNLIAGCTVVLNVEVLDRTTVHRMLDFLNGVTYCLEGEIKRVAPGTFIITPHNKVDITDM